MAEVGVPPSALPVLALLKGAGAAGLLIGLLRDIQPPQGSGSA
jgi:hypothetical protein